MVTRFILAFLFISFNLNSQDYQFSERQLSINQHVDGTLLVPSDVEQPHLVILIAGSGPTDRDGNQNFLQTNCLKKIAHALGNNGIASFRYDKRIVKQIRKGDVDKDIMFDDFVEDAKSVVQYFRPSDAFGSLIILGHSQGSLVGMLAADEGVDAFISVAGAGKSIDKVILEQIERTAPMFVEDSERVLSILRKNETTDDFPMALQSLFNLDVQPFMSNWISYNPAEIIKTLSIPVLVINGTKDLQVNVEEAEILHEAAWNSELVIIESMNHILVTIEGGDLENSKSYNEPYRKLSPELVQSIVNFVQSTN